MSGLYAGVAEACPVVGVGKWVFSSSQPDACELANFGKGGGAEPLLGLAESVGWGEVIVAPEVVELGEQDRGAEVAHGPEGGDRPGHACLQQSDGQADRLVG